MLFDKVMITFTRNGEQLRVYDGEELKLKQLLPRERSLPQGTRATQGTVTQALKLRHLVLELLDTLGDA